MSDLPKAFLSNRLYVPSDLVRKKHKQHFEYVFEVKNFEAEDGEEELLYEEKKTYREFSYGYTGFSRGDLNKIYDVFGPDFDIIDQRRIVPHGYDELEFTGELDSEQLRVWLEWLEYQFGTIEAPARWGKTVLMTWIITRLKQKALVLAQEDQLLDQFEEEFRKFTNVNQLERKYHKKLIGRAKKADHFFPIVTLSSWQMYHHNLRKLREHRDDFGAVFIDEAHSAAAPCYARVVNTINSHYRIAVTATPERKDNTHVIMFDVCGPVVTRGKTEQLPVHIKQIKTGILWPPSRKQGRAFWVEFFRRIMNHERRNQLICRRVLEDARSGHFVLVLTERVKHIYMLRKMLDEMNDKYATAKGKKKLEIAVLHGTMNPRDKRSIEKSLGIHINDIDRKKLRLDAKAGKINIVIAYPKIVELGWNVPVWSSIHSVMPTANGPRWYQRISRVRTRCSNCPGVKHPDCLKRGLCTKKPPVAQIYVDRMKVSQGCYSTLQQVHERLGFVEEEIHEDVSIVVNREPDGKRRKTIKWTEIS